MKFRNSISIQNSFWGNAPYFAIVLITFFGRLIGPPFGKGGIIASVLIILTMMINSRYWSVWFSSKGLLFYQFICVLSIVMYIFNGRPFSLYLNGISNIILPSLFYVFGKKQAMEGSKRDASKVMLQFVLSNIFIIFSGLVILFLLPRTYSGYFSNYQLSSFSEWNFRYTSYIGSIQLGFLCPVSIVLLYKWRKEINKVIFILSLIVMIGGSVISMQRASWIITFVALVLCYVFVDNDENVLTRKKISNIRALLILLIVLVVVIVNVFPLLPEITQKYWIYRFNGLQGLDFFNDRSYQVEYAIETFFEYPFGLGLGAAGNEAYQYGLTVVGDNNYLTILVETGLIGFFAFLILIKSAIVSAFRSKQLYLLIAILCMLIAGVGNSVFEGFPGTFMFWWILGYSTNIEVSRYLKDREQRHD